MTVPTFNLNDFTGAEITVLEQHLTYAHSRLEEERAKLRRSSVSLQNRALVPATKQYIMIKQWSKLISGYQYLEHLILSIRSIKDNGGEIDLSPLLDNPDLLLDFISYELGRNRMAAGYVKKQAFAPKTKIYLLFALDVETRFFERLLAWVKSIPTSSIGALHTPASPASLLTLSIEELPAVYSRRRGGDGLSLR